MKKHIIKLLICATAVATVSSCRDALDIIQEGNLTNENVYKSTSDLQRVLDGDIYNGVSVTGQINLTAQFTDEVGIGPFNSGFGIGPHQFYLDITTGDAASIWGDNYFVINRVVRFLDSAKNIVPTDAEKLAYNSYIAESRALRAFSYLQLITYFSPNVSDPNALGAIVLDHIPTFNTQLPRSTNAEVYKIIEDDLNYAEANLLSNARNASQYFVTKSMIYATKARYYLYTKKYAEAKVYAQKAISESGLNLTAATPVPVSSLDGYDKPSRAWHRNLNNFSTVNPYMRMLQDTERGEVIFSLSRPNTNTWENIGGLFATNSPTYSGSNFDMGRNLYNLMNSIDGDIRKYINIDATSRILDGNDYLSNADYVKADALVIKKYPGRTGMLLRNDVKVFRLSEMYFILAECAVSSNDFVSAADYIKSVRDARNFKGIKSLPVYNTAKDALVDILKERRIELSFEGHRYIDLKRLGAVAGVSIDRSVVDDYTKTAPVTIPIVDYRWTLPIPRAELQANKVIQQNPGYKATP